MNISLCTWNVLSQSYCHQNSFSYAQKQSLQWETRKSRIEQILMKQNKQHTSNIDHPPDSDCSSDIICLQEVCPFEFYEQLFHQYGYDVVFAKRYITKRKTNKLKIGKISTFSNISTRI
jgi:mRNA deadenylase 3'-5' endonuclease subunit Ccr4